MTVFATKQNVLQVFWELPMEKFSSLKLGIFVLAVDRKVVCQCSEYLFDRTYFFVKLNTDRAIERNISI